MAENFSRIENYINKSLGEEEKGKFEAELKNNKDLAERYNFYKNLKSQQSSEIKPIKFDKKILPEINDINFTEKKAKPGLSKGTAAGVIVLFISVSAFLLMNITSHKSTIANMQLTIDSLSKSEIQIADVQEQDINEQDIDEQVTDEPNDAEGVDPRIKNLQKIIAEKEQEIVALKTINKTEALETEVQELKQELAKVKQEYYESAGNYASNTNNSLKSEISSNFSFYITKGRDLEINWKKNKYKVEIYNSQGRKVKSTTDFIADGWKTNIQKSGFYRVRITSTKKKVVYVLIDTSKDSKNVWVLL